MIKKSLLVLAIACTGTFGQFDGWVNENGCDSALADPPSAFLLTGFFHLLRPEEVLPAYTPEADADPNAVETLLGGGILGTGGDESRSRAIPLLVESITVDDCDFEQSLATNYHLPVYLTADELKVLAALQRRLGKGRPHTFSFLFKFFLELTSHEDRASFFKAHTSQLEKPAPQEPSFTVVTKRPLLDQFQSRAHAIELDQNTVLRTALRILATHTNLMHK